LRISDPGCTRYSRKLLVAQCTRNCTTRGVRMIHAVRHYCRHVTYTVLDVCVFGVQSPQQVHAEAWK